MLSKGGNNESLSAGGEGNDPNATVFGALGPADQALRDEAIDSDTDRTWGQVYDWAYRIDGQRPNAQQDFQHAEIREAESGLFNTSGCVPCHGPHRLHHYYPDVIRPLIASGHKNLNLTEVYSINYLDINIHDANAMTSIQKEKQVMRTASVIARYLAGVIFLVMGLNGFLNFIPFPPPAGVAGQFMGALYVSHYLWVIFAFQVIAGVLLLLTRSLPLPAPTPPPLLRHIP